MFAFDVKAVTDHTTNVFEREQLFFLSIGDMPYLINNDFILLYSDKAKGDDFAKKLREKYNSSGFDILPIKKNEVFFAKMRACGIESFLLNGDGEMLNFADYCDVKLVEGIAEPQKLYTEIKEARKKEYAPLDATFKAEWKFTPQRQKNRVRDSAFVIIISIFAMLLVLWIDHPLLPFIAAGLSLSPLAELDKAYGKLEKSFPRVAKLAKVLFCVAIIMGIFDIIVFFATQ